MEDRAAAVAAAMSDVAQVLGERGDCLDLAHRLVHHCRDLLSVSAVGLLVQDAAGELRLLAATSSEVRTVELFQLQVEEGPCLEAFATGAPVTAPDAVQLRRRWPRFATMAQSQGIVAAHTVPVQTAGRTIGALNLFRDREGSFTRADADIAHAMASFLAIGLGQLEHAAAGERLRNQLQEALDSRVVLEQAKGVLAERHRIGPDDAFGLLRSQARAQRRPLREVAGAVVAESTGRVGAGEAAAGRA